MGDSVPRIEKREDEERPFISVIVPTYNDWYRLGLCLDALSGQSYPKARYEVIVVDNESTEEPPFRVEEKRCRILRESTPGSYAARNTGARQAVGNILAFTDSDCIPDIHWLNAGVEFFTANPQYDYAGGAIDLYFRGENLSATELYEKAFAFRQEKIEEGRKYAVTANFIVRREVFDQVGPFNGSLVSGGDWEWGHRAAAKGYRIGYCGTARVAHPARHSLKELLRKHVRVSGGQYYAAGTTRYRLLIILVGLLPPVVPAWRLRGRRDLALVEKTKAFMVLYAMRIVRSIGFILIGFSIMKPRRS